MTTDWNLYLRAYICVSCVFISFVTFGFDSFYQHDSLTKGNLEDRDIVLTAILCHTAVGCLGIPYEPYKAWSVLGICSLEW